LGDKLEPMLAESLRIAHTAGALRTRNLKRVTVDTTVQPQAITFLTDAKLLHASIKGLLRLAKKHHVQLRQSYLRIAKHAVMMARRYAHVKQFKRQHRQLRLLRPRLDRLIRDIRPKIAGQTDLEKAFEWLLAYASQIRSQQAAPARVEASRPLCFCRFQLALSLIPYCIIRQQDSQNRFRLASFRWMIRARNLTRRLTRKGATRDLTSRSLAVKSKLQCCYA